MDDKILEKKKIGLIAGNGEFPLFFARFARKEGHSIIAAAIKEETKPELENEVDGIYWLHLGQLKKLIDIFKSENIREAVMAGQVKHFRLFDVLKLDSSAVALLSRLKDKRADSILKGVADELGKHGIKLMDSTRFLSSFLPAKGILTSLKPTKDQWKDIRFGYEIAKNVAGLDIGQTVVVKDRAVLAVEAMEGTDVTIKRGGKFAKKGAVVVKVSKPRQDRRFDIPIVGERTIKVLREAGISVLAFSAGSTLLLEKELVVKEAKKSKVCLVAVDDTILEDF
ncbi:MAG: UDP-2,3-diacylglucosamine diphosphatase LpxI [bacterium]